MMVDNYNIICSLNWRMVQKHGDDGRIIANGGNDTQATPMKFETIEC